MDIIPVSYASIMISSLPPSLNPDSTLGLRSTFESLQISRNEDRENRKGRVEFCYFTLLPTELRLKIYIFALPTPRLIPLYYNPASLSRIPSPVSWLSPTPSATYQQISRPSNIENTKAEKKERRKEKKELASCTSPAKIPVLLHTCREARRLAEEYYILGFGLCGPSEMCWGRVWFSIPAALSLSLSSSIYQISISNSASSALESTTLATRTPILVPVPIPNNNNTTRNPKERDQDILYFPSLPGYCASFKRYTTITSLLPFSTLSSINRLAVHEDLFLEENKRRGSLDSGIVMYCDTFEHGAVENGTIGRNGGESVGYWNTDDITEERLFDFWRSVSRKFTGVEEVWIVGVGREDDILSINAGLSLGWDRNEDGREDGGGESVPGIGSLRERENFVEMVRKVVRCVEEEMGGTWVVPRWWVLRGRD